jgi:hypothetical protein
MLSKCGNTLKNPYGLHKLKGYGHMLPIIKNKHHRKERRSLMTSYSGLSTSQKRIKMRMKTTMNLWQGE